jgi:hypothetical protein
MQSIALGAFVVARQTCTFGAHPDFEIGHHRGTLLLSCSFAGGDVQAVDRMFDVEQDTDLADSLQRQRRDGLWRSVRRPSSGAGFDFGQLEELAPGMAPSTLIFFFIRHRRACPLQLQVDNYPNAATSKRRPS